MTPSKSTTVKGLLVEQYWWAGKNVVYVDNRASRGSFEWSVRMLKTGKTKEWVCVK